MISPQTRLQYCNTQPVGKLCAGLALFFSTSLFHVPTGQGQADPMGYERIDREAARRWRVSR